MIRENHPLRHLSGEPFSARPYDDPSPDSRGRSDRQLPQPLELVLLPERRPRQLAKGADLNKLSLWQAVAHLKPRSAHDFWHQLIRTMYPNGRLEAR